MMSKAGTYRKLAVPGSWGGTLTTMMRRTARTCTVTAPGIAGTVEEMLSVLGARDRDVLVRRIRRETLDSIGTDLGVTRQRVRQIEMKSIRTLKVDLGAPWQGFVEWFERLAPGGALAMSLADYGPAGQRSERAAWDAIAHLARKASHSALQCEWLSESRLLLRDPRCVKSDTIEKWLRKTPRFVTPDDIEKATGITWPVLDCAEDFFDGVLLTRANKVVLKHWTLLQLAEAVAWELALAGITEFHFSQLGQAMAVVQPERLADASPRSFAALLSRGDQATFVQGSDSGFWRLRAPPVMKSSVPHSEARGDPRSWPVANKDEVDATDHDRQSRACFRDAAISADAQGNRTETQLVEQVLFLLENSAEAMTPHQMARQLGTDRRLVHRVLYRELLPSGLVQTPDGRCFLIDREARSCDT